MKRCCVIKEDDRTNWEIDIEDHTVLNHQRLQNLAQIVFSQNSVIVCVIHTQKLRLNRSLSQASLNLKEECYFGISDLDQPAQSCCSRW